MKLKSLADKMLHHRAKRTVLREKMDNLQITNEYLRGHKTITGNNMFNLQSSEGSPGQKTVMGRASTSHKVPMKIYMGKKPLRAND